MTQGIQYIISENQVEARLMNCKNDFKNLVRKWNNGFIPSWMEGLEIPDTFVAVAKCNPNDTFDPEVGKELAKYRVIYKYNRAMEVKRNWFFKTYTNPAMCTQHMTNDYLTRRIKVNKNRGMRVGTKVKHKVTQAR